jgi:hypothetical protein
MEGTGNNRYAALAEGKRQKASAIRNEWLLPREVEGGYCFGLCVGLATAG